jgi:hypothetical protein
MPHTVTENLQPFGLAIEGSCDVAHTLAGGLEPAETCLDLLCQLRRLLEARVEDVNFSPGLFVGGMPTIDDPDGHGCGPRMRQVVRMELGRFAMSMLVERGVVEGSLCRCKQPGSLPAI